MQSHLGVLYFCLPRLAQRATLSRRRRRRMFRFQTILICGFWGSVGDPRLTSERKQRRIRFVERRSRLVGRRSRLFGCRSRLYERRSRLLDRQNDSIFVAWFPAAYPNTLYDDNGQRFEATFIDDMSRRCGVMTTICFDCVLHRQRRRQR